jgi:TonB family protein
VAGARGIAARAFLACNFRSAECRWRNRIALRQSWPMSTPTELWKNWEGRVVDDRFPLRQWLGGGDHSAVFLTERSGREPQKAAIKLISAEGLDEDAQLSRWAEAGKLSHPHLIRLLESGRFQLDGMRLLYVVMEYAEENLAEILPVRPLSADEAGGMLQPTAEALVFLHKTGLVQGGIKPSNIMAVDDRLKISADRVCKVGERGGPRTTGIYDAPEVENAGLSQATDVWSLGMTLVAVLTQNEPKSRNLGREPVPLPATIPQPLREIARQCLQIDPQQRCTASDILGQLQPRTLQAQSLQAQSLQTQTLQAQNPRAQPLNAQAAAASEVAEGYPVQGRQRRWIAIPIIVVALFLLAWIGSKFIGHQPPVPAADDRAAMVPAEVPAAQSPAPFSAMGKPAAKAGARGSVLQQVMPDVSRSALGTIERGRLKVSVQVEVDSSGNVSQAKLVSAGPSNYFASRSLAAARRWRFTPPQVNGQAVASEWVLRFQFRRTAAEVFPAETRP